MSHDMHACACFMCMLRVSITSAASPAPTHPSIKEAALRAASTKGGGRLRRPPPFVDSSIWVSPWVRVRVFGTPGQRCVVLPMGFSMGLSTQHWTICPLSYGCPPIKPARELEMSRPPKSTGGRSGRELEMSALYIYIHILKN